MRKCGKGYKTSTELEFFNIFGNLVRFCASVIYFENMNPFEDKTKSTDQNLYAKTKKIDMFLVLDMLEILLEIPLSVSLLLND